MSSPTRLTAGDLALDSASREAFLRGVPLKLTRLEFDVLAYLLNNQERAVSRQELLDGIWGSGYSPESNVVDVVVASLRRKLGDESKRSRYILTIPAVGYRIRGGVAESRSKRRSYVVAAILAAVLVIGAGSAVLLLRASSSGGNGDTGAADPNGSELTFVIETRSTEAALLSGDCRSEDLTISGWKTSGFLSGDLTGSVESGMSGSLFYTTGCLEGAAKGSMTITAQSGDRLEMVIDSVFSVVRVAPVPEPAALESTDVLTISGGTGQFANSGGYGSCQTVTIIDYGDSSASLTSAARSHCQLTFSKTDVTAASSALSVRLVANPSTVSLVGAPPGSAPSASYVLVLFRNEGQVDLTDLTLTVLPVEGAAIKVSSRVAEGSDEPPLHTWHLPDLRAGERQVFDFSLQFQSVSQPEVPLRVRLSSSDMEQPVDSEPFVLNVE